MSIFNFVDKTIIITGGGTGLGFTITQSFLESGANVIIVGRRKKKLESAYQTIVNNNKVFSKKLHFINADFSVKKDVNRVINETVNRFGTLNILINNSGYWMLQSIIDLEENDIIKHFNCNLKTMIYGTQAVAKKIKSGGAIVNLSSFTSIIPMKNASIYSCCKASINSFTRSAAQELASFNIRVNCVIPGVIRTPMTNNYIDENYNNIIKSIALRRIGEAKEVANGVMFLCSDFASYITGTTLEITGGKYATQL